ncbi:glycosyltransferase family 2 protein [Streptomyces sp. NPDC002896]|uniref:glycosyltransferase family 2 protein n=1 Tax=Streptomyces sp. NPDC002896 TaxID=3154438 RepID=UPI0033306529
MHIAVLMTCHNRREKTLNALASLDRQHGLPSGLTITVHLVDAGSTDGTVEAVIKDFPDVDITTVGDDVFWGEGMRIASHRSRDFDYQLWLNDDVSLADDALSMLLDTSHYAADAAVVVGAMCSSDGKTTTYSGVRRRTGMPWTPRYMWTALLEPRGYPQPLDTCCGNLVLVPRSVYRKIGGIDSRFPHSMGDWDFGLRARKAGFRVYLAPRHAGVCDTGVRNIGWSWEPGIGVREALRRKTSKREFPFGPYRTYCLRHHWPWAPLTMLSPYVKTAVRALREP